jgi:hypothetical protein
MNNLAIREVDLVEKLTSSRYEVLSFIYDKVIAEQKHYRHLDFSFQFHIGTITNECDSLVVFLKYEKILNKTYYLNGLQDILECIKELDYLPGIFSSEIEAIDTQSSL